MDAVSPLPALAAIGLALACTWLLQRRLPAPTTWARFVGIDGLRGYLAFAVFLHHACIWYFHARGAPWRLPPSTLYTQFGQAAVTLFFMITGFLFSTKLLDGRRKPVDWLQLYVSRVLRLVPLYSVTMLALLAVVAMLSNLELHEPAWKVAKQVVHWLLFTLIQRPDINGVAGTAHVVAGVVWSLPYEWMFYFILPLLALPLSRRRPSLPALLLAVAALGWGLARWQPPLVLLAPFASGLVAALLARWPRFCAFASGRIASLLCLACLALVCTCYSSSYEPAPLLLLSLAFSLIACGNTLFGALASGVSRLLGDMSYSLYLLHGLLLFCSFRFVLGLGAASALTPLQHWLCVLALVPLLVFGCFASLRWIEQPAMRQTAAATARLRGWLSSYRGPAGS